MSEVEFIKKYRDSVYNETHKTLEDLLATIYHDHYCSCGSGCFINNCKYCDNDE